MIMVSDKFWLTISLEDMTHEQWESLCDGCAKCCCVQFIDDDDNLLMQTDVSCRLLDTQSLTCSDYHNRTSKVPDCVQLTPGTVKDYFWLPKTCAYRLVAEGKDLPDWHYLVCGDKSAVHKVGVSIQGKVVSETSLTEEEIEDRVIAWIPLSD